MINRDYEVVIGLEVHAELCTETEDLLRLQKRLRRRGEHISAVRCAWACPARCRC